ncbi:MAG: hypothetical protein ACRDZN_17635 [Acidimicrobiales bacterium]
MTRIAAPRKTPEIDLFTGPRLRVALADLAADESGLYRLAPDPEGTR